MVTEPQGEQPQPLDLIQVPVIWEGADDLPVLAANQFVVQIDSPDGAAENLILTVGHIAPPVLLGSAEEQRAAAADIKAVSVRPLARFSLSRSRATALIRVLNEVVGRFDEKVGG
jgi:hypothetical protein